MSTLANMNLLENRRGSLPSKRLSPNPSAEARSLAEFTFSASILWIILCRQGSELLQTSVAGFQITEIDLLPLVALVAAISMRPTKVSPVKVPPSVRLVLLAWPAWYALRYILPPQGDGLFGSTKVDIRSISMYLVMAPLVIYIQRRGWNSLLHLLMTGAYIVCGIGIASWVLLEVGAIPVTHSALVLAVSANDVRPGGEILVVIAAVSLSANVGHAFLNRKWLSWCLIFAEIAASQTLTIVLAIFVGTIISSAIRWPNLSATAKMTGAIVVLASCIVVFGGALVAGSRFDLAQRSSEDSAQYRVSEFTAIRSELEESGPVLALGAGPGSLIAVPNPYTFVTDVKRDSHDVYATVALKTGLIGLIFYLLPLGTQVLSLLRARREYRGALTGCIVAISCLTIAVPFVWTASGLTALLALLLISHGSAVRPSPGGTIA